jgi:hypothetical protein
MTTQPGPIRTIITAAVTIFLVLGGLLGARLVLRWWQSSRLVVPPNSRVESPRGTTASKLEVPCWSCPSAKDWPVQFQTDLYLIAPLGEGTGNAAEFFAQFEKQRGPRAADATTMMDRRFEDENDFGLIVAPDDELLLEAEPWVDQAVMRFYPEIFPMEGTETRITNLLVLLTFVRSWAANGVAAEDPVAGLEDCRRAIRLGRLLRQDDVVIINDLVGLASIHLGARGVYRIAQRTGDDDLALLASIVLGEVAPQRFMTMEKISAFDLTPYMRLGPSGSHRLDMPDSQLEVAMTDAEGLTERRFFGEVILSANVILNLGTPEQQQRVRELLEELAAVDDAIIADFAQWALDTPPTEERLAEYYPHPAKR